MSSRSSVVESAFALAFLAAIAGTAACATKHPRALIDYGIAHCPADAADVFPHILTDFHLVCRSTNFHFIFALILYAIWRKAARVE